jgi:hypothetical protein
VRVYSCQLNPLVRLVLQRLVVLVDPLLVNAPVGFDGTDHVPTLSAAEFD